MTNPYQSPRHSSSAPQQANGLFVECDCGKRIVVSSAAAGSQVTCGCGKTVSVPRLSELRRMSGQEAYVTNAVEKVRHLIGDGHVPGDGLCIGCGTPTGDVARFDVACEQTYAVSQGDAGPRVVLAILAILGSVWAILRLFRQAPDIPPTIHGRDTSIRLPVWLCDHCQPEARYFNPREARELLTRIGTYAEVFREYPEAVVSRVRSRS
jgi:hypothetical protein